MNKRGQEQVEGAKKSGFIVRIVGVLLLLLSLSWLINVSTNDWVLIGLGIVALIAAIIAWIKKIRLASIILLVVGLLVISLYLFSSVLNFLEVFADILANKYITPLFLLVSGVLLLIVGSILYKLMGLFLLVALFIQASEYLMNLHDIFSFLEPISQYDISLSWSVILVLGIICLFSGGLGKKAWGYGKSYGKNYIQKGKINKTHEEAIQENMQRDREQKKRAQIEQERAVQQKRQEMIEKQKERDKKAMQLRMQRAKRDAQRNKQLKDTLAQEQALKERAAKSNIEIAKK